VNGVVNGKLRPSTLLMVEVDGCRVLKVFDDDVPLSRIRDSDLVYCYDLSTALDGNQQPLAVTRLQVTHKVIKDKSGKTEPFGDPSVIAVPRELMVAMPSNVLRQVISEALAPFMKGGWGAKEKDSDLYTVSVMTKGGEDKHVDVPRDEKESKINLASYSERNGVSFVCFWSSAGRKRYIEKLPKHASAEKGDRVKEGKPRLVDISDCVDEFVKEETLRKTEMWYCSKCKQHKMATKKFDLWKTPDVLIVHLKRFSYNRVFRDKLDTPVNFPIEGFDIGKWVVNPEFQKNSVYDLYAVSNHFGGCGGGHYTAFAKNIIDKRWYNLDDSQVTLLQNPKEQVITRSAYVLFYKRRKQT